MGAPPAWPEDAARALDHNSLLVRSMRARERSLFIADLGVEEPSLPTSAAAPMLAVPIATQHTLLGIALYGSENDGGTPDPEIVDLLGNLCASAASAYTNVEARELRTRLVDLQQRLGPRAVSVE